MSTPATWRRPRSRRGCTPRGRSTPAPTGPARDWSPRSRRAAEAGTLGGMSPSDVHAFPVVSVPPAVGESAPDFHLKDQHGQVVSLQDFHGSKNVVLVFYPFAFSGICTGELCEIRDNIAALQNEHVQVLAVSVDHMFTQRAWAESQGYEFPVLSDYWPHGQVARAYGVV